jgi:hypothetical protein
MIKNYPFGLFIGFAIAAALFYCIPLYTYIRAADYTRSALLYLGNFLFMGVIGGFLFYIRSREVILKMMDLIIAGQKQVLRSVGVALVFALLLLIILGSGKYMLNKPANTIHDKTNGLDFMVIINTLLGNFLTGSFAVIILASALSGRVKRKKNKPI